MNPSKKTIPILLAFFLFFTISACSKQSEKPTPKSEDTPPKQPEVIAELESDIINIMVLSDKVPYFERVIVEKEKIEEEQKMEQIQMSQESNTPKEDDSKKEESSDQQSQDKEKSQDENKEKPKPMTIQEGILDEILKRENTSSEQDQGEKEQPPKDISETWKNINTKIKGVHDKWNVLEPLLIQQGMSPEVILEFEDTLDNLTNHGIANNYLVTIATANKLTVYLPKFMMVFKKDIPPSVYTLKYLVRDIVLNSAVSNYSKAQESLNKIKEQSQSLKSQLIENKSKSTSDKFDASVNNLQKSLNKKDINLIKINGSIVMKNVILMHDDLKSSI